MPKRQTISYFWAWNLWHRLFLLDPDILIKPTAQRIKIMKHILLSVPHRELNTDPDKPLNDMKRHKTEETEASDGGTESRVLYITPSWHHCSHQPSGQEWLLLTTLRLQHQQTCCHHTVIYYLHSADRYTAENSEQPAADDCFRKHFPHSFL